VSGRRILMTVDAVGGVWQYATELARALAPFGHQVLLAALGPPIAADRHADHAGLHVIETGLPLDWLAKDEGAVREAARGIAALALKLGVDLIHLNQPALGAEAMPVPTVAVAHSCVATWWAAVRGGALPADFVWQTRLVSQGLARAHAVAVPSHAFARALQDTYGLTALPEVVHNGRTPLPVAESAMHDFVLAAGRLWDEGKNVATLDRAAARLCIPLKAAGPVKNPGGGTIAFENLFPLGQVGTGELARLLAARPVFASAAIYEPFGLAVLEAAQSGCALVLSDIPTFRELWGDVATFVQPKDDAQFAAVLQALASDPGTRIAEGERVRRHAARFTPVRMAEAMDRIYQRVAASTVPASRARAMA